MRLIDADALKERAIRVSTVKEHCYMKAVGTHEIDKAPTVVSDINVGKWIPVSERLPDTFGEFIVTVKKLDGTYYSDYADYDLFGERWTTGLFFDIGSKVTHWMPIPEPPKEVE